MNMLSIKTTMKLKNNYPTILQRIGNTPLIRLNIKASQTILAKLEHLNPGGSIKDRSALYMIEQAEKDGRLKPNGTIVEASSGNQGIALAMIGTIKGYHVIITVPQHTSKEKIATLAAYGAEVIVCPDTDTLEDPNSYHTKAETLHHSIPGSFMPNQYYNIENVRAHYQTTGPEIWQQTGGSITHLFVGMGSCGTISGAGQYLKEKNPAIKIIGIDAATSKYSSKCPRAYNMEGIGVDVISNILNKAVIDEVATISDKDAFTMTKKLARDYGLLVGISSGAVMHVTLKRLSQLPIDAVVVVIFGDSGRAYLSKVFGL